MALDTYDNLKLAVIDQSHREDLDPLVDDFILLAENDMRANPDEPLNIRANELISTDTTTIDSDLLALPTRYQRSRSLRITIGNSKFKLSYRTPAVMTRRDGSGVPYFYTILGDNIQFDIATDAAYTVTFEYESDLDPLSSTNATNNVLDKYPAIYLYGCLKHAMIWVDDDQRATKFAALFSSAIRDANTAEAVGRFGDSPTRAVGWAP